MEKVAGAKEVPDFEQKYVRSVKALLLLNHQRNGSSRLDKRLRRIEKDVTDNAVHRNSIVQYYKNRENQFVLDINRLAEGIEELKRVITQLTEEGQGHVANLQRLQQECETRDVHLQDKDNQIVAAQEALQGSQATCKELKDEVTTLREQLRTQSFELRNSQQQHKDLMNVFGDLERERSSLLAQQEAAEEDNAELKSTIKTLLYRVEHMHSQIKLSDSNKDTAIDQLQRKCTTLVQENRAMAEGSFKRQQELEKEVAELSKRLRANSTAAAKSQSRPLRHKSSATNRPATANATNTSASNSSSTSSSSSSANATVKARRKQPFTARPRTRRVPSKTGATTAK